MKGLLVVVTGLAVLFMMHLLASMLYSIVVLVALAMVFTYILLVPVGWVENGIRALSQKLSRQPRWESLASQTPEVHPRILAVISVYFLFFMSVSLAAVGVLPQLSHQVGGFARDLPEYLYQVETQVLEWSDETLGTDALKKIFEADIIKAQQEGAVKSHSPLNAPMTAEERKFIQDSVFKRSVSQITHLLEHAASSAVENVVGVITHTLNGLIFFLAGLVLIFYFLLDGHKIPAAVLRMLPQNAHAPARYFMQSMHQVMFNFVKGQVVLAIVSGIFMFILYSIFQVKYAIFLSAFFTVAEILPVIGPWIAFTPGILVILFSDHPEHAFYIWFIYVLIKDNFILPKVVGEVMGLHPVVVIFAILICAKLGGVMGVVLALPVASVLNLFLRYCFHPPADAEDLLEEPTPASEPA
jgi:predicted PurR-regulated permease PerM